VVWAVDGTIFISINLSEDKRRYVMRRKMLLLPLIIIFAAGCSWFGGAKSWSDFTPKEKSTYFMGIYNKQYTDTFTMASAPNLLESQKEVIRAKKLALSEVWPLIKAYDDIAVSGGIPGADLESLINSYINRIILLGVN
jgi:hypothetical protein